MKRIFYGCAVLAFAWAMLVPSQVYSEVPQVINYQGKLTNAQGQLIDGTYSVTFTLFTQASGGGTVWTENHGSVAVTNGLFNVLLGSVETDTLGTIFRSNNNLYLEIKVNTETLSPRQVMASVGYALSGVPSGVIVMWSGTLETIPLGWALCDGNNGTPNLMDKFVYGVSPDEDPGSTGGALTHSHNYSELVAHTHTGSTATAGAHNHTYKFWDGNEQKGTAGYYAASKNYVYANTSSAGAHSHSLNIDSAGSEECATDSASSLPPYYKIAYIIKL